MDILTYLLVALCGALFIVAGFAFIVQRIVQDRLPIEQRLVVDALRTLEEMRGKDKLGGLSDNEKARLMAEAMNYVMSTREKRRAERFLERTEPALGPENRHFIESSQEVVKERFDGPK